MSPLEVLKRLQVNATALLDMGAVEFTVRGRPLAKEVVKDLLTILVHLQRAGHTTVEQNEIRFAELEQRIAALEKGPQKPLLAVVKNAVEEGAKNG